MVDTRDLYGTSPENEIIKNVVRFESEISFKIPWAVAREGSTPSCATNFPVFPDTDVK